MGTPSAPLEIDGLAPQRVLAPDSPEQVAAILKSAADERLAVVPLGGGTLLDLGAPLRRVDILLSLGKLNRVLDYQPANLTVRAEAGLALGALNQQLAAHGQYLPLDPPCPERATLGGILAANASGALRVRYGAARDLIIGIRVALTNGQVVRGGGQVVKNVAGYDLPKLFVGSLGTLGVIVEATFKLVPLPAKTATVVATFRELDHACAVGNRVLTSPLSPLGVTVLDPAAAAQFDLGENPVLTVRFGGIESALTRQCGDVIRWSRENDSVSAVTRPDDDALWVQVRDFNTGHPTVVKVGVLPAQVGEMGRAAKEIAARHALACSFTAHAVGVLSIALEGGSGPLVEAIAELGQVATALRGHCIVQRAPRAVRQAADVWGPRRGDWAVMQKLRQEFDPNGILNPGRFVEEQ